MKRYGHSGLLSVGNRERRIWALWPASSINGREPINYTSVWGVRIRDLTKFREFRVQAKPWTGLQPIAIQDFLLFPNRMLDPVHDDTGKIVAAGPSIRQ